MSGHTAGPWHEGAGNGTGSIFKDGQGRMRMEQAGTTLYPIATIVTGWDEDEDYANSRLIAAAPDLLEALTDLTNWMRDHTGPCDGAMQITENAVAAIIKATGGH